MPQELPARLLPVVPLPKDCWKLIRPYSEQVQGILESAMILSEGSVSIAARALGLKRSTFQSKLNKYVPKV